MVGARSSARVAFVLALMVFGTVACSSAEPPEVSADRPDQTTDQPTAPTAQTGGLWDRLLAPEDFPLPGWSQTYTDSAEIPTQTAQPCGLELDPLLGDPDADFDTAAVRAWTRTDAQPETRVTTSVVESPGAESGVVAARAAVAECELEAEVPSEFGMLTLVPTNVAVTQSVGFCASYRLEMFQPRSMLGLTCHAGAGDHRIEIEALTPAASPISDTDLQAVVDRAIDMALTPR